MGAAQVTCEVLFHVCSCPWFAHGWPVWQWLSAVMHCLPQSQRGYELKFACCPSHSKLAGMLPGVPPETSGTGLHIRLPDQEQPDQVMEDPPGGQTPENQMIQIHIHVMFFGFWMSCWVRASATFDAVKARVAREIWNSTGLWYMRTHFIMLGKMDAVVFAYDRTIQDCLAALQDNEFQLKAQCHHSVQPSWQWRDRRQPLSGGQTPAQTAQSKR